MDDPIDPINPFDEGPFDDDPFDGDDAPFGGDGSFGGTGDDEPGRETVHVNFATPIPIFVMPEVTLLPQQVTPLHIFEPRYRQMVTHALDGAGLIGMAIAAANVPSEDYQNNPPIKPCVCVGRIVQHEKLPDGRYNVLLQGVCRARIAEGLAPDDAHLYRRAVLEPIHDTQADDDLLADTRAWLSHQLDAGPLAELTAAEPILEYVRSDDVPTHALLELVGFALLPPGDLRYRLLSEPSAATRAGLIHAELDRLSRTISRAKRQDIDDWPKGCAWN